MKKQMRSSIRKEWGVMAGPDEKETAKNDEWPEAVIFCQAPADLPYALTLVGQFREERRPVSVFVVNVEGIYRFLQDLHLPLRELAFIPYCLADIKKLHRYVQEKKRLSGIWNRYFGALERADVYFFSRFEDWLTSYFLHRFSRRPGCRLYYVEHYDDASIYKPQQRIGLRRTLALHCLRRLTGIRFKANIKEKFPEFPVECYPVTVVDLACDWNVLRKYFYNPVQETSAYNVLYFAAPCNTFIFNRESYDRINRDLIRMCRQQGYRVFLKGHPRMGVPSCIREAADAEIPAYIPGEFIDKGRFDVCFGIDSSAICHFAKSGLPTCSLIDLFDIADRERYTIICNYLKKYSDGKIKFVSDRSALTRLLEEVRNDNTTDRAGEEIN